MFSRLAKHICAGAFILGSTTAGAFFWADDCRETDSRSYEVRNSWGDSLTHKHAGYWNFGSRSGQRVKELELTKNSYSDTFNGTVRYEGEGPIQVYAIPARGINCYEVYVRWGKSNPGKWSLDGHWRIGSRDNQTLRHVKLSTFHYSGYGLILAGEGHYEGEGPIRFLAYTQY